MLVMIDSDRQCSEVLKQIREYLTSQAIPEEIDVPANQQIDRTEQYDDAQKNTPTEQLEKFVAALNSHDNTTAVQFATKLAQRKTLISLSLTGMTRSESMNDSHPVELMK